MLTEKIFLITAILFDIRFVLLRKKIEIWKKILFFQMKAEGRLNARRPNP